MNNKLISTKSNAIFLAAILIVGTFAAISPSFIIKGVNAQSEPYYDGMENNYEKSYGKDRDKSSKDSNNVDIKIKCNNINLNINNGQGVNGNATNENIASGNETNHAFKKFDKDFVCINNNNNGEQDAGNQTNGNIGSIESIGLELIDNIAGLKQSNVGSGESTN